MSTLRLASILAVAALAPGATFTVNNTAMTVDAAPGNGVCADSGGQCTLRAAIMEANALAGGDTIDLAPGAIYTIATPDNAFSGLPVINTTIRINGNGATIRRSGASGTPNFRVFWVSGNLTLDQATVAGGTGSGGGGLRLAADSFVVITRSTISGNTGQSGGAILNFRGDLTLENSTVSGSASRDGFGGAGILSFGYKTYKTRIINSSIIENRAEAPPGFGGRGDAVAGGPFEIRGSILASPVTGLGMDCYTGPGSITSLGYSIASDASCALTGPGDLNSTDPKAGPLGYNGGPTPTHALMSTSPAINLVPVASCIAAGGAPLTTDQRGVARPQGSACDAGSFETAALVESWTATGPLGLGRFIHNLVPLPSGKILAVGGHNFASIGYLTSAEIYDPGTGNWSPAASMPYAHRHQATRLANGDVLAVGDDDGASPRPTAARYNEAAGTWSSAGVPVVLRYAAVTVPMGNGKVLYAAGYVGGCCIGPSGTYNTAEVYDPSANTWTAVNPMAETRMLHTGTLLGNGKVLIAGGAQRDGPTLIRASAELFDPVTSQFTPVSAMAAARGGHTATLLANGKVLVAGGFQSDFSSFRNQAELFDPATNTWSAAGAMATARARHTAVLLPSGKVLVAGGDNGAGPIALAETYDPATNTWSAAPPMASVRTQASMALLPDGRALVAAGRIDGVNATAAAEIYQLSLGPADTTPPVITVPAGVTVDATSPSGATVAYAASASDNSGTVSSFTCSPASGSVFPVGDTVVLCVALDPYGNAAAKSFTVHVRGPAELLAGLAAVINGMGLPNGIANSLVAKLNAAASSSTPASCNQINAFLNDVNAQSGNALTAAQASQLVAAAQAIRVVLGC